MSLPQIELGNESLANVLISSVEVVQSLNTHWWCTLVCRQTLDQRIPVEQLIGKALTIKTLDDEGVEHVHFSGFVYEVNLNYEAWGSYTATLTAVTSSYLMDITRHKQYYVEQTLSSIAGTIASRAGLSVDVNASGMKALNYVQYGETDFSFLHRIVDDYGCWMRPKDSGVEVFSSFQAGSTLKWREEGGLIGFTIRGTLAAPAMSGAHYDHHAMQSQTFERVSASAKFYDGSQSLTSAVEAASQALPAGFEPQRARAMTLDDYNDQLQAESVRAAGASVNGNGSSRNQQLKAGDAVTLAGEMDAKGTYGLIQVKHHWTPAGYINHFSCTPWRDYRNPKPPVAQTWHGVVNARVIDHDDPKKMGRLKLQFFWQGDNSTHWARATAPHAGPDRGFMFMPEIGDEVAVIFEDGDPERPVIIGSLWNGVHQAPRDEFYGSDIPANNVKRFVSKGGSRMQMVDTVGQETVLLATPKANSIKMTESYTSTGGRPMIILQSTGDIMISAPNGRIHFQSAFFSKQVGEG